MKYTIPEGSLATLRSKVAKLAKKGELALAVLEHTTHTVEYKVYRMVTVEITGEIPVISGWSLQARVDHVGSANVIVALPGSQVDLTPYRECHGSCDHCHTTRDRSSTFVLLHTTGEVKRIGRSCLADFCRSTSVDQFVASASAMATITRELESESSNRGTGYDSLAGYLARVVATVEESGWVSSAKAKAEGSLPTSELATALMRLPSESEIAVATQVILWARQLAPTSDYTHNLRAACSLDYVLPQHRRLVASAVAGYLRATEEAASSVADNRSDSYLAPVGSKVSFSATITRVHRTQGQYGTTTILSLRTPEGHALTWFASGDLEYSAGQTVTGKGTVKAHNVFQAEKQTILTRCKLTIS